MRVFPAARPAPGVTLLEILIALTIMGLIAGVLWGALRLGVLSWEKGEATTDEMQRLRIISEQLSQDLGSIFLSDPGPYQIFEGSAQAVLFLTNTAGLDPSSSRWGVRKVAYRLDDEGNLVLEERFPFEEELSSLPAQSLVLARGVSSLHFRYYDPQSDPPEWKDTWRVDTENRLPAAIEVTLALVDPQDADAPEHQLPTQIVPIRAREPVRTVAAPATEASEESGGEPEGGLAVEGAEGDDK